MEDQVDQLDLAARVEKLPGCKGLGTLLADLGVHQSWQLGRMSDEQYEEILKYIPKKRHDFQEDITDRKRWTVGHLMHLDKLRKDCQEEMSQAESAVPVQAVASETASSSTDQRGPSNVAGVTSAASSVATHTAEAAEAGTEEPSAEDLRDATSEAEEKLLSKIETALEKVNNPDNDDWNHIAGASLTKARQLVAESPQNGMTSEQAAVLALGCIAHAIGTTPFVGLNEAQLEKADPRGCQKKLSEAPR